MSKRKNIFDWVFWIAGLLLSIGLAGFFISGGFANVFLLGWFPLWVHQLIGYVLLAKVVFDLIKFFK